MDDSAASSSRLGPGLPLSLGLLALALVTVLVARGLSSSLPGAFGGIDEPIRWVGLAADHLTQFSALVFGVLALRLSFLVVASPVDVGGKALAAFATLATVSAAYVSTGATLHPSSAWLASMGALVSSLGLYVVGRSVGRPAQRGAGLVVLCVTLAGTSHLLARWLLVQADDRRGLELFGVAQGIATGAFVLELAGAVAALAWLLTAPPRATSTLGAALARLFRVEQALLFRSAIVLGLALVSALALVHGVAGWRLLLSRTLLALGTHPDPLVPSWLGHLGELLALLACCSCVLGWARKTEQRVAVALALLARASFDVPLGGLFALCAFLSLLLESRPHLRPGSRPLARAV